MGLRSLIIIGTRKIATLKHNNNVKMVQLYNEEREKKPYSKFWGLVRTSLFIETQMILINI